MRWYGVILSLVVCLSAMAFPLHERYAIVLPAAPSAAEQSAAKELQDYLQQVTGQNLVVVREEAPRSEPAIYLGWSAEVRRRLQTEAAPEQLSPDEVILRSFPDGSIVMTGEGTRGTLYAVYTFLEEFAGIRWFTPEAESVPRISPLELPDFSIRYAPPFAVRSPDGALYQPSLSAYLARLRVNGHSTAAEYGGNESSYVLCNRSHTICRLVPDENFYRQHPDYYAPEYRFPGEKPELFAWRDGRRITGEAGQPCLTHPEVKALVIANSSELIKRRGSHAKSFLITQNDNTNYCRCENCEAMVARLGSQTDLWLWFLNDVAVALEKEFPGLIIETFAYQYTLPPPRSVRPHANLRIRLCLIEADSRLPLTDDANRRFQEIVAGWGAVTRHLAVWHYLTNFSNFGLIHPNFASMDANLRFFAEAGVTDVFSQDSREAGAFGFFPELRGYLNAKLLWNPKLDRDVLTGEFLTGYYGAAAGKLQEYIDLNEAALQKSDIVLDCYQLDTVGWLPWPVLRDGARLLADASALVADDPVRHERVEYLRTAHDWSTLCRLESGPLRRLAPAIPDTDFAALRQNIGKRLAAIPQTPGYKNFYPRLGTTQEQLLAELDRHLTPPAPLTEIPTALQGIAPERLIAIPVGYDSPAQAEVVADHLAPGKQAVRLRLGNHNWALRADLPAVAGAAAVQLFAELRLPEKVTQPEGLAAIAGVYVHGTNFAEKSVIPIPASALSNTGYALILLGTVEFRQDHQIYFEGTANPSIPELLLARIWLVMP